MRHRRAANFLRAWTGAIGSAVDSTRVDPAALEVQVATQNDHARISFARATGRYFAHLLSLVTLYVGYLTSTLE